MPQPLADRLRPHSREQFYGQEHILVPNSLLQQALDGGFIPSIILWGPPGCGKTTLAKLLAQQGQHAFVPLSAIHTSVSELRKVFEEAQQRHKIGQRTLLFIDEIHRFNRSQQDTFLPYMEDGTITLIGATTENPSFELNPALLSRAQVYHLKRLSDEDLKRLLQRACKEINITLMDETQDMLIAMADGDGRSLLNNLENLSYQPHPDQITPEMLKVLVQKRAPIYDKNREEHYNLISAVHKSIRGSDPDAALYWFQRMIQGGEDPSYLLRRLIRCANEDIGLADPQAIVQALSAQQAYHALGSPEGELSIAQCIVYLATAPKSNALYKAFKKSKQSAQNTGSYMPPYHILNAPTQIMKEEGYASGYIYDHDTPHAFSGQNYFPSPMTRQTYYEPVQRGFEREIEKRLEFWKKKRSEKNY